MRNLSISARIIAGFMLLLGFLIISGLVSHLQMGRIHAKVDEVVSHDMAFYQSMSEVRYHMGNLRRFEKDSFINFQDAAKRKEYFEKWEDTLGKARKSLDEAAPGAPDSNAAGQLDKLKTLLSGYEQGYRSVSKLVEGGTMASTADANKAMSAYKGNIHDMETLVGKLAEQAKAGADRLAPQVSDTVQAVDRVQLILIVAGVLVGSALAIVIGASIRRPLAALVAFSHQVADTRNLSATPPELGRNEIGEVAQAFGSLVVSMRELIQESHHHADDLVSKAEELAQVSHQVAQASHRQSDAASASAAAIKEVTVSINEVAANADGVQQQAQSASGEADKGGQLASRTAQDIREIAASITAAGELIEQLNLRSDEIGAIVQVIRDIAEQTNLLALNAAIEAARAGEMGRGFAVVADEVRKLAERTSQATGEISSRITGVQTDTKAAFQSMQEATSRIENGVQGAYKVEESLKSIRMLSEQSVEKVTDMASAIQEQSHASQDLAQNMEQISQMNDNTNQAVQQSSALAADLKKLSNDLNAGLNRFVV